MIPLIHRDLSLDEKSVGLLNGLAPLLLAAAAIPGSLLIAKVGARRALIAGLLSVAVASALRGLGPSVPMLFAASFVMAAAISVIQPAFPSLVRLWFPDRVGLATALYSNGLLVGEIIPAALTVPLVLPLVGGGWELSFAAWSLPVLLTALLVAFATPHARRPPGGAGSRWWPRWGDPQTWYLGLIFGGASAVYWGANAFIPDYLHATGRPGLVAASLTSLNAMQIPASIGIGIFSSALVGRRWPFVASGAIMLLAIAGFLAAPGSWSVVWAGAFGFTAGGILVLTLALPPLLAPDDTHRLSAGVFTITYTCSFLGPLLGGAAWDATGRPALAFLPGIAGSLAVVLLALRLRLPARTREPART